MLDVQPDEIFDGSTAASHFDMLVGKFDVPRRGASVAPLTKGVQAQRRGVIQSGLVSVADYDLHPKAGSEWKSRVIALRPRVS